MNLRSQRKDREGGMTYRYGWRNNEKRLSLHGRKCVVLVRGRANSALVEFENGQREIVSRNALKRAK